MAIIEVARKGYGAQPTDRLKLVGSAGRCDDAQTVGPSDPLCDQAQTDIAAPNND